MDTTADTEKIIDLCVHWYDADGRDQEVRGDSLPALQAALAAAGYDGCSIRVVDAYGWTYGWVSASYYRAA